MLRFRLINQSEQNKRIDRLITGLCSQLIYIYISNATK